MTLISTLLTKLAAALASLAVILGLSHSPVAVSVTPLTASGTTSPAISAALSNSTLSPKGEFSDKNWTITFTIDPKWNVNEIIGTDSTLHQIQISGTKQVVFISKNEGIGLSNDLQYATATRTIAGQSVEVRTYAKPSSTYAYYQTFALKETDGTYNFLLKSATADTSATEAFITSIAKK